MDQDLIERLATILAVLNCGIEVNWSAYHDYSVETYRLMVERYPWYYIPSSVHSVLLHAAPLMSVFSLPPTFFDEGMKSVMKLHQFKSNLKLIILSLTIFDKAIALSSNVQLDFAN